MPHEFIPGKTPRWCANCQLSNGAGDHFRKGKEMASPIEEEVKRVTEIAKTTERAQTKPMAANERQIGGTHYKIGGEEHWDRVARLGLDYFQGQITKYVERWKKKNGLQDLEKARHFLDKYIEIQKREQDLSGSEPGPGYTNQDGGSAGRARQEVAGTPPIPL